MYLLLYLPDRVCPNLILYQHSHTPGQHTLCCCCKGYVDAVTPPLIVLWWWRMHRNWRRFAAVLDIVVRPCATRDVLCFVTPGEVLVYRNGWERILRHDLSSLQDVLLQHGVEIGCGFAIQHCRPARHFNRVTLVPPCLECLAIELDIEFDRPKKICRFWLFVEDIVEGEEFLIFRKFESLFIVGHSGCRIEPFWTSPLGGPRSIQVYRKCKLGRSNGSTLLKLRDGRL